MVDTRAGNNIKRMGDGSRVEPMTWSIGNVFVTIDADGMIDAAYGLFEDPRMVLWVAA